MDVRIVANDEAYPGEENSSSIPASRVRVTENWNTTRVIGATETLISNAPCRIGGVYANATSVGTISTRDAAAIAGGTTAKHVLDATAFAKADGAIKGTRFEIGLTVQGFAAGTDFSVQWMNIN